MTDALLSAGIDRCRRAGTTVSRSTDAAEPPAIATPTDDSGGVDSPSPPSPDDADAATPEALLTAGRPVAVEPLREADPTVALSRVWNNRANGRATLFVVPTDGVAGSIERLLSPPAGIPETDGDGRRFHLGPDRIRLEESGYAAVPTGPDLAWHETTAPTDPAGLRAAEPGGNSDTVPDTADEEGPWLELRAGDTVLARLAGVDALACPSRARFPYAYRRDRDKQIRVVDFAGRPVQRYPGIGAMRRGGFRPVPAPLVPERIFDGPTAGWWAVLPATE